MREQTISGGSRGIGTLFPVPLSQQPLALAPPPPLESALPSRVWVPPVPGQVCTMPLLSVRPGSCRGPVRKKRSFVFPAHASIITAKEVHPLCGRMPLGFLAALPNSSFQRGPCPKYQSARRHHVHRALMLFSICAPEIEYFPIPGRVCREGPRPLEIRNHGLGIEACFDGRPRTRASF